MIAMDKSLLTTVGVVVCLAVTIYLFRELNKARDDVEQLKNVSMHLMQMAEPRRTMPMPMPTPTPTPTPTPEPEPEVEQPKTAVVEEIVEKN